MDSSCALNPAQANRIVSFSLEREAYSFLKAKATPNAIDQIILTPRWLLCESLVTTAQLLHWESNSHSCSRDWFSMRIEFSIAQNQDWTSLLDWETLQLFRKLSNCPSVAFTLLIGRIEPAVTGWPDFILISRILLFYAPRKQREGLQTDRDRKFRETNQEEGHLETCSKYIFTFFYFDGKKNSSNS